MCALVVEGALEYFEPGPSMLITNVSGLSLIAASAATAIDRRIDLGGAAIGQRGAADQFAPDHIAVFGLELQVQRHFLWESAAAAEALEIACVSSRGVVGLPGAHDGLPQRPLERLVLFVKTVLPFQERRFRGR